MVNVDFRSVLNQATAPTDRPIAAVVVEALLTAEKATKDDRIQFLQDSIYGTWRLYFVSSGKLKLGDKRLRGFYLPKLLPATIAFAPSEETPIAVTNKVTVGLITLLLTGPARYEDAKNILPFDFTRLEVKVLGQTIYNGKFPGPREGLVFSEIAIAKLPFFAFFQVNESFIAARGRGGGLAMWVKQD